MPELPEVETIARGLAPLLTGRRIVEAVSAYPPIARPDFPTFRDRVTGRTIVAVHRRAKLLLLDLSADLVGTLSGGLSNELTTGQPEDMPASGPPMHVVFHLKMSGSMSVGPTQAEDRIADKHTHLLLRLDNGTTFFFREIRKFGYAAALTTEELESWEFYRSLGPEPLEATEEEFVDRFPYKGRVATAVTGTRGSKVVEVEQVSEVSLNAEASEDTESDPVPPAPSVAEIAPAQKSASRMKSAKPGRPAKATIKDGKIKALLLDQTVIAGIGNIYADESLFRASIHPETRASSLKRQDLVRLYHAVQEVLSAAIAASGSSIRDYRDAHGFEGGFQNSFQVYGKGGEPCPRCGRKLESIRVAGRTTTFCRKCQR